MKAWRWAAMASVCAALALTGCLESSDDTGSVADANIAGRWNGQWTTPDGLSGEWTLDLVQTGNRISGTDSIDGVAGQITGVVDGNVVALTHAPPGDDDPASLNTASLHLEVDRDAMIGSCEVPGVTTLAREGSVVFTLE